MRLSGHRQILSLCLSVRLVAGYCWQFPLVVAFSAALSSLTLFSIIRSPAPFLFLRTPSSIRARLNPDLRIPLRLPIQTSDYQPVSCHPRVRVRQDPSPCLERKVCQ